MDYIKIVKKIDNFVLQHFDLLELLYPRDSDFNYSILVDKIICGRTLVQLQKEVSFFYRFQGMDNDKRKNLLKLFDEHKENIKTIDNSNVDEIYDYYCKLLKKAEKITGKFQYVNTAKLLNIYNQSLPLFDNNVINFLNYINSEDRLEKRNIQNYYHILKIYKIINESDIAANVLKLRNKIYAKLKNKHINLNKFVDTLMYFINDTKELFKYKSLYISSGKK